MIQNFTKQKVIKAGCLIGVAEISFKEEDYNQFKIKKWHPNVSI